MHNVEKVPHMCLEMARFGVHFTTSWKLTRKYFVVIFNVGFGGRVFPK